MEEKMKEWSDRYCFSDAKVSGYRGGYPIVEFLLTDELSKFKIEKKHTDRIIRKAELSAGMELGVGLNFRKTAFAIWNGSNLVICGHESVIEKVLQEIFSK